MADHGFNSDWVDRYVRDELSGGDEASFEEALLEDPILQREVEAALAIRETLRQDPLALETVSESTVQPGNSWAPYAMAASVLLAVISTTLFWRANIETNGLQKQIIALQQPRTSVLQVPVNIMRSSSSSTPDVVILKPPGQGVIVLNIELSPGFKELPSIEFALQQDDANPFLSWVATPGPDGRTSVVLIAEPIPNGLVHLNMFSPVSGVRETRLLEFRSLAD